MLILSFLINHSLFINILSAKGNLKKESCNEIFSKIDKHYAIINITTTQVSFYPLTSWRYPFEQQKIAFNLMPELGLC